MKIEIVSSTPSVSSYKMKNGEVYQCGKGFYLAVEGGVVCFEGGNYLKHDFLRGMNFTHCPDAKLVV